MNESVKAVLGLWGAVGAIVAAVFVLVGGSMALMGWAGLSAKAAGFVWCGIMFVGVVVFFSWLAYDDHKFWSEFQSRRQR